MGLFDEIKRGVQAISQPLGYLGEQAYDYVKDSLSGGEDDTPEMKEDPRLDVLRQRQQREADKFRSQLPSLRKEGVENLKSTAQRSLDTGVENTRKAFNRRGLLYSGLREEGEQSVRGQVASQLQSGISGISRDLEKTAQAKEDAAMQFGLDTYRDAVTRAENLYNMQLENAIRRRQNLQQIGQSVGTGVGMYLGYNQNPNSFENTRDLSVTLG